MRVQTPTGQTKDESGRTRVTGWEYWRSYLGLDVRTWLITVILAVVLGLLLAFFVPTIGYGQSAPPDSGASATVPRDGSDISGDELTIRWESSVSTEDSGVPRLFTVLAVQGPAGREAEFRLEHSSAASFFHYGYLEQFAHVLDFFRRPEHARDLLELHLYDAADARDLLRGYLEAQGEWGPSNSVDVSQWWEEEQVVAFVAETDGLTAEVMTQGGPDVGPFVGAAIVWNEDAMRLVEDDADIGGWLTDAQKTRVLAEAVAAMVAASNGEHTGFARMTAASNARTYVGVPWSVEDPMLNSVDAYTFKSVFAGTLQHGSE